MIIKGKIKDKTSVVLFIFILAAVGLGVYSNTIKKSAVDHSRIPGKVELSKGYQRWITNIKNKDFKVDTKDFELKEENEVYNSKWVKVYSLEEPGIREQLGTVLAQLKDVDKVVFSPSGRELLDYRNTLRDGYNTNEVRFYGQKEDKVLDARILDCSIRTNCYFDRAYFLDNDVFVISELSRAVDKKDLNFPICLVSDACEYTFKEHLIDLINNKRYVYESKPFTITLTDVLTKL